MDKKIEKIYKRAFELKNDKKYQECIDEFIKIIDLHKDPAGIANFIIASLYELELKDAEKALPYAKKAVIERPKSEKRSICLVHCLHDTGRHDKVTEEIKRYIATGNKIEDYKILFNENNYSIDDFK